MSTVLAILLLWQWPIGKESMKYTTVKYQGTKQIARRPRPATIELKYDDLYPGERVRGGCSFRDQTKLGSYMPVIESDEKHVIIQAPRGHIVEWECHWLVSKSKQDNN